MQNILKVDSLLINYNKTNPVTHSLLIYKDDELLFEKYYNGFNETKLANLKSVTKSVTSLLIGIAIEKGMIKHENQKLIEIMPELFDKVTDEKKKEITIRHLLTMSAGFEWNNFGGKWRSGWDNSKDPNKYLIEKVPLKNKPGEIWNYNSGLSHLLSGIVKKCSGVNSLEYAKMNLFKPLSIEEVKWEKASDGNERGNSELWLKPKDLAKIGLMMLNDGRWKSKNIISRQWIDKSTKKYFDGFSQIGGYGYHWHTRKFGKYNSYLAAGWGGQFLIVIPALNLVIVNTSKWNVAKSTYIIFELIEKHLIRNL
ncbi:MAG: serine hydrolase [Melioribacter sp.]|uniref:serine hydrolase domain-containing protein n=1 Tax=Rosettibacter primus TaxID=3111523 RepID=UPI00247CEA7B|nr:serine hydrolase [Melioribacter sp.]